MKFPYKEKILHFIWQYQYFDHQNLETESKETLQILKIGYANPNEGPDFLEAQLKVGNIVWAGSIEIHPKSQDWEAHLHHQHVAYEQVILHIVYEKPSKDEIYTLRPDGTSIPILVLEPRINKDVLHNCLQLIANISPIACSDSIASLDPLIVKSMLDKSLIQRLAFKSQAIMLLLDENNKDWDETTYQWVAQNFGFKINSTAFLKLAKALPLKILLKHADNLLQVEALLFGVAGMLEANYEDVYFLSLKKEYHFLAHKYDLKSKQLSAQDWMFLRLRPDNFPTIRMSQLAALVHHLNGLLSKFLHTESISELKKIVNTRTSAYWQTHYVFDKQSSAPKSGALSETSKENIIINSVATLWVAYLVHKGENDWFEKVVNLLESIAPEKNKITRTWSEIGVYSKNAFDSQALIELFNHYCKPKNCLSCSIGYHIIKRKFA
jgi:hypothetical protein